MLKLLDQREQAKLQWLQDPRQVNEGNPNNVRHLRNRNRGYQKNKINELTAHSKNKNIRDKSKGINEFMKGYQFITTLVKRIMAICLQIPTTF
jgi:hypothetical protein